MTTPPFVAPAGLAAVEVTGADRVSYLDAVLAQQLSDARPGDVVGALELDVHGASLAMMDIAVLSDRLVLLVPEALADDLVARLGGRTFLADARFERGADALVSLRGDGAHGTAGAAGLAVDPARFRAEGDVLVLGRDEGIDLAGPKEAVTAAVARLVEVGAAEGDAEDLDAWRVHTGVPRWGVEVTGRHLPEELGLLPTHVHLAKGCYPGQEAVARMWMLGRPRRRLALVDADGPVEAGWQTGSGRRRVQVTGVTDRDGTRRGLAFVPSDAEPGQRFDGDDGAGVEVLRLIGADRPVPGHDPATTRRRDR